MTEDYPKYSKTVIEAEADRLAKRLSLEPERLRALYHRLDEAGWYAPKFPFISALEEAFKYVKPQKALEIFENEKDLQSLCERDLLYDYLREDFTPFYSLDTLSTLIQQFIQLFTEEENRRHLLKTGYPHRVFVKSLWLDYLVNRLYFVKIPLTLPRLPGDRPKAKTFIEMVSADVDWLGLPIDKSRNLIQIYHWANSRPLFKKTELSGFAEEFYIETCGYMWENGEPINNDGRIRKNCIYEDAGHIPELGAETIEYLESKRGDIFDLKVKVLDNLHSGLVGRNPAKIRGNCVRDLSNSGLWVEDWQILLGVDQFYSEIVNKWTAIFSKKRRSFFHSSGGLTQLLMLVGHCIKELKKSAMHLSSLELKDDLKSAMKHTSYYETYDLFWHRRLDQMLDEFRELELKESEEWKDFKDFIIKNLDDEIPDGTRVFSGISRKFSSSFKLNIFSTLGYSRRHFYYLDTAPPPRLFSPKVVELILDKENQRVIKDGKTYPLNDCRGRQFKIYEFLYSRWRREPEFEIGLGDLFEDLFGDRTLRINNIFKNNRVALNELFIRDKRKIRLIPQRKIPLNSYLPPTYPPTYFIYYTV